MGVYRWRRVILKRLKARGLTLPPEACRPDSNPQVRRRKTSIFRALGFFTNKRRFACVFGLSYLSAIEENISVMTVKNLRCSARIRTKAKEFCAKAPF